MSLSLEQRDTLHELLWAARDGDLSAEQTTELDELIVTSDEARRLYADYLQLFADLRWSLVEENVAPADLALSDEAIDQAELESAAAASTPAVERRRAIDSHPRPILGYIQEKLPLAIRWDTHPYRFGFVTSMLLLCGIALFFAITWPRYWSGGGEETPFPGNQIEFVARITGDFEVEWADDSDVVYRRGDLTAGQKLSLAAGLVEITFADGAVVVLDGPATFVVDQAGSGTLGGGRLTAMVPPRATGFVIDTPTARVVDLGTEFGVEVDSLSAMELHMFTGRANIVSHNSEIATRLVVAGEAVRIDAELNAIAATEFREDAFRRSIPEGQLVDTPSEPDNWFLSAI